ncbi:MAG: class II glutamine amidotransferase [Rhodospirillaceae bacterium]|nr:class II glutamine amidotransferase [Rhodospirillaceae bacterium]
MCRWITYAGPPIYLEKLIYEPENSLVRQSLSARRARVPTNGDGSGIGWYGERDLPGLYRETRPAWNDPNLRSLAHQIRSRLFFAHVRASTGTAASIANCHPFAHGRWIFMHNGQIGGYEKVRRRLDAAIPDDVYNARVGTTDSEAFFYLLFGQGLDHDPPRALARAVRLVLDEMARAGTDEPFRMTAALSDGRTIYALRYASDPEPPSLYFARDSGARDSGARDSGARDGERLMVVSEPLDADEGSWTAVDTGHLLVSRLDAPPRIVPFAPA